MFSHILIAIAIKVNGDNYLLWSQYSCVFVGVQRKIGHLLDRPPDTKDPSYYDWLANGYCIIIWFLNPIEEKA